MVMNGFDTNFDRANEVYAVNTVAFAYEQEPIRVKRGELVRIYLAEHPRVRPPQLVPHPRELLRRLPDRHVARAHRAHRHDRPGPGPARDPRAALPVHGQVHVPRPRVRVRGARLDGLLRGRGLMEARTAAPPARALAVARRARAARRARRRDRARSSRSTRPASSATACRSRSCRSSAPCSSPGEIELHVRNDGPDPVAVKQVIVNDAFVALHPDRRRARPARAGEITIEYPWIEGEAYEVGLLTATGGTIDHSIEVATETPDADVGFYGLMALIGLYVGVIPVAIGMLWLPWVRRIDPRLVQFVLALTVGLLAFLGIDALLEGTEIAGERRRGVRRRGARAGSARWSPTSRWPASTRWLRARRERDEDAGAARRGRGGSPCSSRSASACTTSARGSRSARPTRSARSRSAPRWSSASRCTTPPRGWPSSRPVAGGGPRARACRGWRCSASSRARRRSSAPSSAPRPSTRAWPRSCSASGRARSPR